MISPSQVLTLYILVEILYLGVPRSNVKLQGPQPKPNIALLLILLQKLIGCVLFSPIIDCDNIGATNVYSNPFFHSRMKHVAIDFHFIRDQVQKGSLRVAHVSSSDQLAGALTKPLSRTRFQTLKTKIGISYRAPS